jgi:hypothetical protein
LKGVAEIPFGAKQNAFVGQLQLKLLFDLLLVIDSAIKHKVFSKKFFELAVFLLKQSGHELARFGEVADNFKVDFEGSMQNALDGKPILPAISLDRLQCDVIISYILRNHLAHGTETPPIVWEDFDRIQRAVFRTFCATVDYLY